ncbi:colicin immunity domain-containing protein [Streptomyces peucetius]|uniref:Colicin immunity domain-containing protein n=1 Tax=Streptomyces peucetius TaxID=1950 RepID=A0ABY6I641_STRPE|nr:colicin immunity domain-containing protein [Streptomyces peucetius]UYQ62471.1 colicin immunity domain-containing protein [Streptomyces peucetius]
MTADGDRHGSQPPAWSHPDDVAPTSAAARQLALLNAFDDGTCSASDFAHGWWQARRTSQTNGERVLGALGALLDQVFMILEDYSIEPGLAEPGDLDDDELRTAVRGAWEEFRRSATDRSR